MRFPISIGQIELDATAHRFASVYADGCIAKIRAGFAIPDTELNNVDLVAGSGAKFLSKIAGEPARLQLEFVWDARREKERALTHAR
jgi:hypothetical protein